LEIILCIQKVDNITAIQAMGLKEIGHPLVVYPWPTWVGRHRDE